MSQFKCVHCDLPFRTLCETVDHNIITHPTEELRVIAYVKKANHLVHNEESGQTGSICSLI